MLWLGVRVRLVGGCGQKMVREPFKPKRRVIFEHFFQKCRVQNGVNFRPPQLPKEASPRAKNLGIDRGERAESIPQGPGARARIFTELRSIACCRQRNFFETGFSKNMVVFMWVSGAPEEHPRATQTCDQTTPAPNDQEERKWAPEGRMKRMGEGFTQFLAAYFNVLIRTPSKR